MIPVYASVRSGLAGAHRIARLGLVAASPFGFAFIVKFLSL